MRCQNNMRQIGLAMHIWQADHRTVVPRNAPYVPIPGTNTVPPTVSVEGTPEGLLSWMVLLLPQIDQGPLFTLSANACAQNRDPLANPPHVGHTTVVPLYTCPTDSRLRSPIGDANGGLSAHTSYIGLASVLLPNTAKAGAGVFGMRHASLDFIRDGTSNTVMLGERPPPDPPLAGWWYPRINTYGTTCHGPNTVIHLGAKAVNCDGCVVLPRVFGPGRLENPCDRYHLWSLHPRGANFLFADGSVRFLSYSAYPIVPALVTVAGGEVVTLDD
jgi:prepilin-type processing-associated H-X9-DG protein